MVAQPVIPALWVAEAVCLQIQWLPMPQDKFKANLGNLVRLCLKIKREKRLGCRSLVEHLHNVHKALDSN